MKARIEASGSQDLLDSLRRMGPRGEAIGLAVLSAKAQQVAMRARTLVPVDDVDGGDLRDSIRVSKPNRTRAGRISAGIVAGGAPLARLASERGRKEPGAYAVVQHEDLTLQHNNGQAKFIEQPALEIAPTIPAAINEAIRRG